jgi:hypothetical protein
MTKTPHKWANVIKAWADGYPIQFRRFVLINWSDWIDFPENFEPIIWDDPDVEFRIKPEKELQESYKWFKVCYKCHDETVDLLIQAKNLEDCKKQFSNAFFNVNVFPGDYTIYEYVFSTKKDLIL